MKKGKKRSGFDFELDTGDSGQRCFLFHRVCSHGSTTRTVIIIYPRNLLEITKCNKIVGERGNLVTNFCRILSESQQFDKYGNFVADFYVFFIYSFLSKLK